MVSLLQIVTPHQRRIEIVNTPLYKTRITTPKNLKIREICAICDNPRFRKTRVRFPNRTIGVNLGIFSSVFESLKGCVFSSTFLKSASMVKRLFYGIQSFAKCRF